MHTLIYLVMLAFVVITMLMACAVFVLVTIVLSALLPRLRRSAAARRLLPNNA
jgi:hypothetical protein